MMGATAAAGKGINGNCDAAPLPKSFETGNETAESDLNRRSSEEEAASVCPEVASQARRVGGSDGMPPGLRGLVNLGNTCFMGTVLQALLHTPPLARFYLGGGHPHTTCRRGVAKPCLSCELEAVFSAAYSGERKPFSPTSFLTCWWQLSDSLAGYRQQDAHEFYLFMLSGLEGSRVAATPTPSAASPAPGKLESEGGGLSGDHGSLLLDAPQHNGGGVEFLNTGIKAEPPELSGGPRQPSPAPREPAASSEREGEDEGVADKTFGGLLRSDVICSSCGYVSTVYEPFVNISLDVEPPGQPPPPLLRPPQPAAPAASPRRGKKLVGAAAASSAKAAARKARAEQHATAQLQELSVTNTPAMSEETDAGVPFSGEPPIAAGSVEASRDEDMTEGAKSNIPDASNLVTNSTDGNSSVAGSATVTARETGREETLSSPPKAHLQAQQAWGPLSASKRPPSKAGKPSPKRPKVSRCGECHTCRNKHLKKACLRNVQLKRQAEEAEVARLAAEQLELDSPGQALPPLGSQVNGHEATALVAGPSQAGNAEEKEIPPQAIQPPSEATAAAVRGGKEVGQAAAVSEAADASLVDASTHVSLLSCLRRYVRPERLAKWLCDRCSQREAAKQVSIRRLPPVLCLHLKRFQHPGTQGAGRKVVTPVLYAEHLDMRPYLSSTVLRKRYSLRAEGPGLPAGAPAAAAATLYELYAVVCHKGNLQGGHYIAYVKSGGRWFQCDDALVVEVPAAVACGAQAYMLYYRLQQRPTRP